MNDDVSFSEHPVFNREDKSQFYKFIKKMIKFIDLLITIHSGSHMLITPKQGGTRIQQWNVENEFQNGHTLVG
jgi:hypothetical protein